MSSNSPLSRRRVLFLGTLGAGALLVLGARRALAQENETVNMNTDADARAEASAEFSNTRCNRTETAFGRLVADALRATTGASLALVSAGALREGTLEAGPVERADFAQLLSFGEDKAATLSISGAQLRAALERGVAILPTGSPAFLHASGLRAVYDPRAASGRRLISLQVGGRDAEDGANYTVALPISLAEGAAGYFNIWNGARPTAFEQSLLDSLVTYARKQKTITPDETARVIAKA